MRDSAPPFLCAFGETDESDLARLNQLSNQIARADGAARYVNYAEAERLAGLLAERLSSAYGREEVRAFEFRAIPTGGFIVLGMLAYALGLPARSLTADGSSDRPLVMVDDCVLSGLRFSQTRASTGDRKLVLATLFAPAPLAAQAVARHSFDCVAAVTLRDLAPELYAEAYPEWHGAWEARMGDSVLWVGQPEYLCFAWNEPESSFHNRTTGEVEPGFRLVGPDRCSRMRSLRPGNPRPPQTLRDGPGPYRAADAVAWARMGDEQIAVASFGEEQDENASECYLLEGSAADMWTLIHEYGRLPPAARALAELYDADPREIEVDMRAFADSLVAERLLVRG